jgi:hypothetical protein
LFGHYGIAPDFVIGYPKRWAVSVGDDSVAHFSAVTGEQVSLARLANAEKLPLRSWYQQFGGTDPVNQYTDVAVGNANGIRSFDGLTYYVMSPAQDTVVYRLRYEPGTSSQINFITTFGMIIKSLQINAVANQ